LSLARRYCRRHSPRVIPRPILIALSQGQVPGNSGLSTRSSDGWGVCHITMRPASPLCGAYVLEGTTFRLGCESRIRCEMEGLICTFANIRDYRPRNAVERYPGSRVGLATRFLFGVVVLHLVYEPAYLSKALQLTTNPLGALAIGSACSLGIAKETDLQQRDTSDLTIRGNRRC